MGAASVTNTVPVRQWIDPDRCRFVLVPGLTDDERDIAHIARFTAGLGNVQRVDVLPFHQMGKFKWKTLGLNYTLAETEPPTHELVERACAQFRAEGLEAY